MNEYVYSSPSVREIQAIQDRAHRMRAEAMRNGARWFAAWVRSLFAGGVGAPVHR